MPTTVRSPKYREFLGVHGRLPMHYGLHQKISNCLGIASLLHPGKALSKLTEIAGIENIMDVNYQRALMKELIERDKKDIEDKDKNNELEALESPIVVDTAFSCFIRIFTIFIMVNAATT